MIFLSLKTYKQATGDNAVSLCQKIKQVIEQTKVSIIPIVQPFDVHRIKQQTDIEVWVQHLDPIDPDRHFGWLSPYSAKQAGASGCIINHAEHEIDFDTIRKTVAKCKQYDLKTLVITDSFKLAQKVDVLKPDFLAFERPDLIGGKLAMIDAETKAIKKVIAMASIPVIIGAGINTQEHVKKTVSVGGAGVILASAVIKAKDQQAALLNLAVGFK